MTKLIKRKISETRRKLRRLIYPYLIILFSTTLTLGILTAKAAAPSAPSGLTSTPVSYSQINLSWSDVSGETRYELQRAPSGGNFSTIASNIPAQTTFYQDTGGLVQNTTYYYWIRACNTDGCSGYSEMTWTTTPFAPPAAPSNLQGTSPSPSRIDLSWTDNSNNETGFKIEISNSSTGLFIEIATNGANSTSFSQIGLISGTTYYYRVRAYNTAGNSAYAGPIGVTTQTSIPTAPSGLTISGTPTYNQVVLAWSDNSLNEQGFKIERSLSSTTGFTQIGTAAANSTSTAMYQDNTVSPSTTYYYRVRAYNTAGNSGYTLTVSATTPAAPPSPPSNMAAVSISHNQINLTFRDNSNNEIGFVLERSASESFPTGSITAVNLPSSAGTGSTVSYQDTNLNVMDEAKTFYYRVLAKASETVKSGYSNTANATTKLKAPTALTAELITSPITVNLAWTDNSGAEQNYVVEKSIVSATDGFTQLAELPANTTTYSDTYPDEKKTIYYRVYAKTATLTSQPTNVVNVTTPERTNVQKLSQAPALEGSAYDIHVSGNYAYVIDGGGLQIIDISDQGKPIVKNTFYFGVAEYSPVVSIGNDYVLLGVNNDIKIIDIKDPYSPSIIGSLIMPGPVAGLTISGDELYIALSSSGIAIVDISDVASPRTLSTLPTDSYATKISVENNIAVVAVTNHILVLNVADPAQPTVITKYTGVSNPINVILKNSIIYVANYTSEGIVILNCADPQNISELSRVNSSQPADIDLSADAKYLYFVSVSQINAKFDVYDVSNTSAPILKKSIPTTGTNISLSVNNSTAVNGTKLGLNIIDITNPLNAAISSKLLSPHYPSTTDLAIKGNLLYAQFESQLFIYDNSNPAKPRFLGQLLTEKSYGIAVDDRGYAYISGTGHLSVINVSDPANPTFVKRITINDSGLDAVIAGTKLYIANYQAGLTVYNIADPRNPVFVKTIDTAGQALALTIYNNRAYVADGTGGMQIINLTTLTRVGGFNNGATIWDVDIKNNYAFLAAAADDLIVVDISTDSPPTTPVATLDIPGSPAFISLSDTKPYAFINTYGSSSIGHGLCVVDISTLSSMKLIAHIPTRAEPKDIEDNDRYIYAAGDRVMVQTFDLYYDKPKVEKKASVTQQTRGGEITYTLTITNSTPYKLTGLSLSDDVPIGTTFIEASNGGQLSNNKIIWTFADIPPKQGETDGKIEVGFKVRINY